MTLVREGLENDIRRLHDEIAVDHLIHRGEYSRELSIAATRLHEAELMVIAHGVRTGTHLVVDKRRYAEALEATKDHKPREPRFPDELRFDRVDQGTDETDQTETASNV